MFIKEYRILLPISVDEFNLARRYAFTKSNKMETGGREGYEYLSNEAREEKIPGLESLGAVKSQYTHKRIHLSSKVPDIIRNLAPNGSLELDEKAWNAYPLCYTEYSNMYMKDAFYLRIQTKHESSREIQDNVFNLSPEELAKRQIDIIDIANDPVDPKDYKEDEDPTKYTSAKTGRGPLLGNWQDQANPMLCCYKLVKCEFNWKLMQTKVEAMIAKDIRRILLNFHRQVFCWTDEWFGLTLVEINEIEANTKDELNELRESGEVSGMIVKG